MMLSIMTLCIMTLNIMTHLDETQQLIAHLSDDAIRLAARQLA
jgi:hypothetical protein